MPFLLKYQILQNYIQSHTHKPDSHISIYQVLLFVSHVVSNLKPSTECIPHGINASSVPLY